MRTTVAVLCLCAAACSLTWAAEDESSDADLNAALKRRVEDFSFEGTLEEALSRYEELSGIKIIADWRALEAAGIERTTDVAVEAADTTVAILLKETLDEVEKSSAPILSYIDGETIQITSRAAMVRQVRIASALTAVDRPTFPRSPAEIELEEVPFSEVIDFIREASDVNFHVNWKALALAGVDKMTPVTVKAKGLSFERLLDIITDEVSGGQDKFSRVYWVVDRGIVKISTGEALNTQLRTEVHDVADLLMVIPDFQSPRIDVEEQMKTDESDDERDGTTFIWEDTDRDDYDRREQEEETLAERREKAREDLIELIKSTIGRDMWQDGGGKGSIRLIGKRLVVSQTLLGFKLMSESVRLR
ncbi:MAG: hypothetical protein ACYTF6_12210 [Planctomycetota bacterium]|jgi:hypothetical protein